ncbi:DUF4391 domain-containing protein [Bifidobacterium moukalabense]|uniref:DUF4391 domain-containing protein n=1 Tax=Bifidobacterium moukalabense TaxID=1333651 RepID=UPI0010F567D9|nr:DUF4391 domain-containing protein [Bifidobacterium moukalabense]
MTIASCGLVTALTLGLPNSAAIPAGKANLPKGLFAAKAPLSAKTKQRLVNDIEAITMIALLRVSNTSLAQGVRIPEILVIGLRLHGTNATIPSEIIELIAAQRKSGIVFTCVRDADFEGTTRQECAFAVRRALPGRAGHTPTFKVFSSAWTTAGEAMLLIDDPSVDSMDALWESLCSQVIFESSDPANLDARIVRHTQVAQLQADIDKLTRDHQRAKNPEQRNEIFAKLHKAKKQLEALNA